MRPTYARGRKPFGTSAGGDGPVGQEPEPDNGVEKPQSDEAHSAFTPPFGVPLPPPPEDGQTTSEFARPAGVGEHAAEDHGDGHSGFRAPRGGPAAAAGVAPPPPPATGPLSRSTPWQDRMRVMLRTPMTERPTPERTLSPTEETALPVPRVLDLTLRIGELLLMRR